MARDPLQVLKAVRRRAVEQARYALAACQTAEVEIADKIKSIDATVFRDRDARRTWHDADQFLEMSARRREAVQAERRSVTADLEAAALRSDQARGVVTAARTAAEAVEQLIGERKAASQVEAARREQHVMDDIARARLAARRRSEAG